MVFGVGRLWQQRRKVAAYNPLASQETEPLEESKAGTNAGACCSETYCLQPGPTGPEVLQPSKIVPQMGPSVQTYGFLGGSSHSIHKTRAHVFPIYSENRTHSHQNRGSPPL